MRWRQGAAAVAAATALLVLGACGGGGGEDAEGPGEGVGGDGEGDGGSPPTAGPGEAGVFTGPSGGEDPEEFEVPGCGDIDAPTRLQFGEFEELLAELQCIFDNADRMPPGAVDAADRAATQARDGIAARDEEEPEPEVTEPEPEVTEPEPGTTEPEPEATTSG